MTSILEAAGHDPARVVPIATADLDPPRPAPRPANSVLDNAVLRLSGMPPMPAWRDALGRLVDAAGWGAHATSPQDASSQPAQVAP